MDSECSSTSQYPMLPSDPYEKRSVASSSAAGVDVPPIFLSHSGKQKPFVEHLYNALQNANQTPFFDKHTLPKAAHFPDHIKQAARGCTLGVVVLSDTFLTSKWPMLELEMLVLERGSDALVLPLFYQLHPSDLKASANLSRWRSLWKEKGGDHAYRWDQAVRTLDSINGEVFVPGTSEITYINSVVHRICTLVPCNVQYSLPFVQGHQRLVEEVSRMFEQVKDGNPESSCMVGLHGVGGLGKTTLCKSMVNFYTTQYLGRSWLIEFPSDSDPSKITQECKRALKKLTDLSDELLSNVGDNFDKLIHLMEEHMSRRNVFLAIDNVWETSREKAERLLQVRFSGSSKILLTSRSELLLQNLLAEQTSTRYLRRPLPAPEYKEAFQIFQKSVKLGDLKCLVDEKQISSFLKRCRFNGKYHALALKALAQYVRSESAQTNSGELKDRLSVILEEISSSDLEGVEKVIMLSYKSLPPHKKHMFLDIAHLEIMKSKKVLQGIKDAAAYKPNLWLYRLHGEAFSKSNSKAKINRIIYELALDGLIEIGAVDADGEKTIGVHDLYLDFAWMEAANSPRFFTEASLTRLVEEIEWGSLERVMLLLGDDEKNINVNLDLQVSRFLEELQQQKCRKLKVLVVYNGCIKSPIHLDYMPALRVLLLTTLDDPDLPRRVEFRSGERRNRSGVLEQTDPCQLQVLSFHGFFKFTEIAGLDACQHLRRLELYWCVYLEKIDGLSGLVRLEAFVVSKCRALTKLPDLSGLMRLESLTLKEVGRLSSALKHVSVVFTALKNVPDVSGLTCLETLELSYNGAMEEVGGMCFSSTLKSLQISGFPNLRKLPRWNDCVHLQTLKIANLHEDFTNAGLERLASLQVLCLSNVHWSSNHLHEQFRHLTCLEKLSIVNCGSNIEQLEVGSLSSLKFLCVDSCDALREIGDLSRLQCLEEVEIFDCDSLEVEMVRGLVGISTHLKRLNLDDRLWTQLQRCQDLA